MTLRYVSPGSRCSFAIFAGVGLIAAWVIWGGQAKQSDLASAARSSLRKPSGAPQLVSVQPLPGIEGPLCEWVPASAQTRLVASLWQERAGAPTADARRSVDADRNPIRVIRDTYPTFSSAVLDPVRNEIVANDENLFQIMVYDRLANTPPTADFTEPKRMISGPNTTLEFECGIYVDPATGDIYTLANDVGDRVAIFSRQAEGDVAPNRVIHTPHGIYGIVADEERQEIFLSVQGGQVVVYDKKAAGDAKPLRVLRGPRTRLGGTHGIAIDTRKKLLFVANHGNYRANEPSDGGRLEPSLITIFPLDASGDIPPIRVIQGPTTQLNWPALMYADAEHEELFVANDGDDSILVFRVTDGGDVAPIRVLKGPKTGLKYPGSVFVDTKNEELIVSNMGNHTIAVFPRTAKGNVAPLRVIRAAPQGKLALTIVNPGGVDYDEKREEILVPN